MCCEENFARPMKSPYSTKSAMKTLLLDPFPNRAQPKGALKTLLLDPRKEWSRHKSPVSCLLLEHGIDHTRPNVLWREFF